MPMSIKSQRGASLLFLITSILCLCLISALCLSEFSYIRRKLEILTETQRLRSTIEQALIYSRLHGLELNFKNGTEKYSLRGNALPTPFYSLPAGVTLSIKPEKINFYSSGVNSPARFILQNSYFSCQLTLSLRGRIKQLCADY